MEVNGIAGFRIIFFDISFVDPTLRFQRQICRLAAMALNSYKISSSGQECSGV